MKLMRNLMISLTGLILTTTVAMAEAIKVEIVEKDGQYQLLRGGKPYYVKGAGIDHLNIETLVANGGNSLRTWSMHHHNASAQQILDKAHSLGVTVSLGLDFARERHGFDYNDPKAVAKQFEETKAQVLKFKDHPALLTWFIGNELNYNFENPKVYDAVNQVAKMIHEVDPNHPVTTTLAGFDKAAMKAIKERAPDLDFISFQLYADVVNLPKYLKKANYTGPYFVTEWGAVGHWEVFKTKWDAAVETTSSEKASNYAKSFLQVMQPEAGQLIGNYVFLWGQKQERTATWYGMFLASGEETEAIDIMHYAWTGQWPKNRAPRVSRINLNKKVPYDNLYLYSGSKYPATVKVIEPDNDDVTYFWEVRHESEATEEGGDAEEIPEAVPGLIEDPTAASITLKAPKKAGAYRLYVYVYDGKGKAGHSNFPFYVK